MQYYKIELAIQVQVLRFTVTHHQLSVRFNSAKNDDGKFIANILRTNDELFVSLFALLLRNEKFVLQLTKSKLH